MNLILRIVVLIAITSSCKKDESTGPSVSNALSVKSASTYTVEVERNITYGQALSHQTLNSSTSTTIDLKLDVYKPANNPKRKPAIVLIHGGGFSGGDKADVNIVNLANYFASRGWFAI